MKLEKVWRNSNSHIFHFFFSSRLCWKYCFFFFFLEIDKISLKCSPSGRNGKKWSGIKSIENPKVAIWCLDFLFSWEVYCEKVLSGLSSIASLDAMKKNKIFVCINIFRIRSISFFLGAFPPWLTIAIFFTSNLNKQQTLFSFNYLFDLIWFHFVWRRGVLTRLMRIVFFVCVR